MAITNLSNLVEAEAWASYVNERSIWENGLIASTAIVRNPLMEQQLNSNIGGRVLHAAVRRAPTTTGDQATTEGTTKGTAQNARQSEEAFIRNTRSITTGHSDLTSILSFEGSRIDELNDHSTRWSQVINNYALSVLAGVMHHNADDSSNTVMIYDVAGASGDAGRLTATNFNLALGTIGARQWRPGQAVRGTLVVRPEVVPVLTNQNLSQAFEPSTQTMVETYRGFMIAEDDTLPMDDDVIRGGGTNGGTRGAAGASGMFSSYILGTGAIEIGFGRHPNPVAAVREELEGTSGGVEYLITRQMFGIRIPGFEQVVTSPAVGGLEAGARDGSTAGSYADPTTYDWKGTRRKQVPIVQINTVL